VEPGEQRRQRVRHDLAVDHEPILGEREERLDELRK